MFRILRLQKGQPDRHEIYYVDGSKPFGQREQARIIGLLKDPGYVCVPISDENDMKELVEIGPRLSVETPFSSNAVSILRRAGIPATRVEMSRRFEVGSLEYPTRQAVLADQLDRMTQEEYPHMLERFMPPAKPEPVRVIAISDIARINAELGLGMDESDIAYYSQLFAKLKRNPTDVELMQLGNMNSEHSRHGFFRGIQEIDGTVMVESLMDIVRAPLRRAQNNGTTRSLTAFHDNSGVQYGFPVRHLMPRMPGAPSSFVLTGPLMTHITATAETHNHPTLVAPFPGAETGSGGCIRDKRAVGRGGLSHVGFSGYCTGDTAAELDVDVGRWREIHDWRPDTGASPLAILLQGSDGVADYGNKIGEPCIGGFTRSFSECVFGDKRSFLKPVLYAAGLGSVLDMHYKKRGPKAGMVIVRIGGPAYRIGVGGGSASSLMHGQQKAELDFKSVQRGDAEMENRVNRVIQACAELRRRNPILSIHDQGAGGPSNVLTELMEKIGGTLDIRKIAVGDPSMSVLELWVAEFQEGYGLLINPRDRGRFKAICDRENVNCEFVGRVTGSGRITLVDSWNNTKPVDLPLSDVLGDLPRKRFVSTRRIRTLEKERIPENLSITEALNLVFRLKGVGSKRFLTNKKDRSVTGLVARQQNCGPAQIPVADCAVKADSMFGITGAAASFGENPNLLLISPSAGARRAVAEMYLNMAGTLISHPDHIVCRANWMWPAKLPHEGADLYDAAIATRDTMMRLGIVIDGGKDSLSMATKFEGKTVASPGQLVIMGYAPVPDVRKVVTPDFKGNGVLAHVSINRNAMRMGGSALLQALGQLGNECPDVDDEKYLRGAYEAMQECIRRGWISACHDVSDGGLITAVAEMCMAGEHGARIRLDSKSDSMRALFNEEPGLVLEIPEKHFAKVAERFRRRSVSCEEIGSTAVKFRDLYIRQGNRLICSASVRTLRLWWEETATRLELRQANPACVSMEHASFDRYGTSARPHVTFAVRQRAARTSRQPKIAVLREEGTNGDREMAAAFHLAGFEAFDLSMNDLIDGREDTLDHFRAVVYPGGFSFADVLGSAKGWAAGIRYNSRVRAMFERFYDRANTISLGVCNGAQLMPLIGVVPYRDAPPTRQMRFVHNESGRFESRWSTVQIAESSSIFLKGMEGSRLGIWVDHGEGKMHFEDDALMREIADRRLAPISFVNPLGRPTMEYPFNPNGSPNGWTALCSPDGRHLAMMPHPERCVLSWQVPWQIPQRTQQRFAPWMRLFQNAYQWCIEH